MLKKCILAVTMLLVPTLGHSFEFTNCYVRGFTGYNLLAIPSIPEVKINAHGGYVLGGYVGYKFSDEFRLEGELSYRNNQLKNLVFKGDNTNIEVDLDGDVFSVSYMGNFLFDLPCSWAVVPYFGGGIGGYREDAKASVPILKGTPDELEVKSNEGGIAYQAIVGLNFVRYKNMDCGLEYRFLSTIDDTDTGQNHTFAFSCLYTF